MNGSSLWNRSRRLVALALLASLTGGCATAPRTTVPDEAVDSYLRDLADSSALGEELDEFLTNPDGDLATFVNQPRPPLTLAELQAGSQNGTFRMVNGVSEYRIGAGDVVRLTAYIGPEAQVTRMRVQPDGTIFIPRFQIGTVEAAGFTPSELSDELIELYRQYVPDIYVEVDIDEFRAWSATVLGEIRGEGSGEHTLTGRTTVVEFIYDHGGPTETANLADVRLVRGGREAHLDVMAAMLRGASENNPVLETGDVVFVPSLLVGASRYFVLGAVRSPGVFTYTEGIRVLDALAQAGSYAREAEPSKAFVARLEADAQREVIPVNISEGLRTADPSQNIALQPGDVVVMPQKGIELRFVFNTILQFTAILLNIITISILVGE